MPSIYRQAHQCLQSVRDVIPCQIDPTRKDAFIQYARNWGQVILRFGADLIGLFAPHEGSSTPAYGICDIGSLAEYETYRARARADPLGQESFAFAQKEKFLLRENRIFLKRAT